MERRLPELEVRRPRHGEGRRMAELYRQAFGRYLRTRRVRPLFQVEESLVAVLGDQIVGLACTERAEPDLDAVLACLQSDQRRFLEPLARALPAGEPPAVTILAPPGLAPVRGPTDQVFAAIAVDPRFRRKGIGQRLARLQLELARWDGAGQVFAHCVDGSGSQELFRRLGLLPLVQLARYYPDGTGMTLLYAPLC